MTDDELDAALAKCILAGPHWRHLHLHELRPDPRFHPDHRLHPRHLPRVPGPTEEIDAGLVAAINDLIAKHRWQVEALAYIWGVSGVELREVLAGERPVGTGTGTEGRAAG
jgi:hypothetical protein